MIHEKNKLCATYKHEISYQLVFHSNFADEMVKKFQEHIRYSIVFQNIPSRILNAIAQGM